MRTQSVPVHGVLDVWLAPAALGVGPGGLMAVVVGSLPGHDVAWVLGLDAVGHLVLRTGSGDAAVTDRILPTRLPLLRWTHARIALSPGAIELRTQDGAVSAAIPLAAEWSVTTGEYPVGPQCSWYGAFVGCLGPVAVGPAGSSIPPAPAEDPADVWRTDLGRYADDRDRPRWHFLPPAGWMNEPHGVLHHAGRHHLFYQRNELGPFWGAITWGHAVSDDLVHWADVGSALIPRDVPSAPDGIWSGSAAVDEAHVPLLFFTAGDGRDDPNQRTAVARAASPADADLLVWEASDPPVTRIDDAHRALAADGLELLPGQFRDPYVWHENGTWFQLVGAGIVDHGGTALLHSAPGPSGPWSFVRPLMIGEHARRPDTGVMWELPSLVPIGSDDGRAKHLFLATPWWPEPTEHSLQHQWYWIGEWDPSAATFTPDHREPRPLDIGGYLTGVTPSRTEDGRTLLWSITQDLLSERDHRERGWAGSAGVPLEAWLRAGRLALRPIAEVTSLRGHPRRPTDGGTGFAIEEGASWDLEARVALPVGESVTVAMRPDSDRVFAASITVERVDVVTVRVEVRGPETRGVRRTTVEIPEIADIAMRVLVDHSVVEAFVGDLLVITTRAWASVGTTDRAEVTLSAGGVLREARVWMLESAPVVERRHGQAARSTAVE